MNAYYPEYFGMTDALGTRGTDDVFFYIQTTLGTNNEVASQLPRIRYDAYEPSRIHNFTRLLRIWYGAINKIVNVYPIDLIFFNVIAVCYFVVTATKVCYKLLRSEIELNTVFLCLLFCPFMFSNGLVLVREAWIACGIVYIINCMLDSKIVKMIPGFLFLAFLRPAAVIEVLLLIWFIILATKDFHNNSKSRLFTLAICVAIIGIGVIASKYSVIMQYFSSFNGLTRTTQINAADDTTLSFFYGLPALLRVPTMTLYYFLMPLFNVGYFVDGSRFIIRDGYYTLFGLANLILLPRFINGFCYAYRNKVKNIYYIGLSFIVMMLFLSQISQVTRHKTAFVFLYYIVCAFGKKRGTRFSQLVSLATSGMLIAFYAFTTIRFFGG